MTLGTGLFEVENVSLRENVSADVLFCQNLCHVSGPVFRRKCSVFRCLDGLGSASVAFVADLYCVNDTFCFCHSSLGVWCVQPHHQTAKAKYYAVVDGVMRPFQTCFSPARCYNYEEKFVWAIMVKTWMTQHQSLTWLIAASPPPKCCRSAASRLRSVKTSSRLSCLYHIRISCQ